MRTSRGWPLKNVIYLEPVVICFQDDQYYGSRLQGLGRQMACRTHTHGPHVWVHMCGFTFRDLRMPGA